MNWYLILLVVIAALAIAAFIKSWLESKPFPKALKELTAWLIGSLVGLVKGFLSAPFKSKLIQIAVPFLLASWGWLGALFALPESTKDINPWYKQPEDYSQAYKKLEGDYHQARLDAFRNSKDQDKRISELTQARSIDRREMRSLEDSLGKLGYALSSFTAGSGSATVSGEGELDTTFQDNWLYARITPPNKFRYTFTFELGEVTQRFIDMEGKQLEVYSVSIRSQTDPDDVRVLGSYMREIVMKIPDRPDLRRMYWNDLSLNADYVWAGEFLEGGMSLSFFTWTAGGLGANDVILRFPEAGLSTNLRDSHHLFLGARFNLGYLLPLLQDFYISPKYGLGFGNAGNRILLGIGTTL